MDDKQVEAAIAKGIEEATPGIVSKALEGLTEQIGPVVTAAVSEAVGEVSGRLEKVETAAAEGAKTPAAEGEDAPVTQAQLTKLLADRDAKVAEDGKKAEADAAGAKARDEYVATNMKDLPAAYGALMPATADEAELKAAEQKIREQAKAEAGDAGWEVPDVGEKSPEGKGPGSAAPDNSKMSPVQKIQASIDAEAAGDK